MSETKKYALRVEDRTIPTYIMSLAVTDRDVVYDFTYVPERALGFTSLTQAHYIKTFISSAMPGERLTIEEIG